VIPKKKTNQISEVPIKALERAIFDLHGCKAKWVESIPVKEVFEGETAWEGVVEVFDLEDHPRAKRCYAWSYGVEGSKKRKFFVVLHEGPVKSAQDAVRAAIVSENRSNIKRKG
jgi:hypothetical protein